ncbi:hypothetical protein [Nocardia mexicana]|uniref:Toxin-antitoxin system HicB family antitoxin n=1 Tax=Nocardia mexicana TaxID=279262 RepID=A0A370GF71_9NOCA|nr:hypothetical protein [Nocardia mexicana]RDI41749.1 hypothetical protein DFR68_13128 [Nocardia mexicana]
MTKKLSITMPDATAEAARTAAAAAGKPLSTWIADVVDRAAWRAACEHDTAVLRQHGLLGDEWAKRQALIVAAPRGGRA